MNPYIILAVVVMWIGSLFGVGRWQNEAGHTAERVSWQAKDNQELAQANAKIILLETAARAQEHQHAAQLAQVATTYEKEKADVAAQKDSVIAQLRAGTVRLHDPYSPGFKAPGSPASPAAASTGRCDGGEGSELSQRTSEFLVGLASRADEVVKQLQACQAVVKSDRKGPAP